MRLKKTLLFALVILACTASLRAQDLHNTLYYMNPIHINPAFAGAFEGTFRIGGIYRDQARSVVSHAYSTPSLYIDAPILFVAKRHWIGVGALMFRDQAGAGKLQMSSLQLTGTFHAALDKKSKNVLTLGVQWGKVGRSLKDVMALQFGDFLGKQQDGVLNPTTDDQVIGTTGGSGGGQDPEKSFTDINLGLMFKATVSKTTNYNIGFSLRHLTKPDNNFKSSVNYDLPRRLTAHAQLNTDLNNQWTLNPELYFSAIDPAKQFQLHAWTGYRLNPEKNIKINFGLGYRFGDSGQVLLGMDYGDIKAALAYDITLSQLSDANGHQGGFEVAVYYIGKIYKKPDVKPVIVGPHL